MVTSVRRPGKTLAVYVLVLTGNRKVTKRAKG
jgi:hypothetical protein